MVLRVLRQVFGEGRAQGEFFDALTKEFARGSPEYMLADVALSTVNHVKYVLIDTILHGNLRVSRPSPEY